MIWVLCKAEERAGVNAPETYGSPNVFQCALLPFVERLLFSGRKFASLNFEIVGVENRAQATAKSQPEATALCGLRALSIRSK